MQHTLKLDIQPTSRFSILKFFGLNEYKDKNGARFFYIENDGQFPGKKQHIIYCSTTGIKHDFDFKSEALRELSNLDKDYNL